MRITIEIDEELLISVQRLLSIATIEETIEEALREVMRARARREEIEALSAGRGMDLGDQGIMAKAWRS
jgi:Arc/MetJ family transcription regulator